MGEPVEHGAVFQPPPFHPDRPSLVAPVRVDPAGEVGPTRKQARGPHWRRSSFGCYVPSTAPLEDPQQRIVEASALLRAGDGVTGWAALNWLGGRWFGGLAADGTLLAVPLVTQQWVATQPGTHISQEHLRHREVLVVDGLPVTSSVRAVCYEMRHASTDRMAVVALDMAAYSDLVSIAEARAYNDTLGTWTGVPRSRRAIPLADENSWSPQEVLMRLVWTGEGGRPRPLCNVPVFDGSGRHVGTPDLLDPVAGVLGEYDSSLHLLGAQRTKDVRREGAFRALGLECVTMLGSDHADDHCSFLSRLDTAYANARYAAEADRRWTIVPPRWWIDTTTVEARRNLSPQQRERLLRHRRAA